MGFKNSKKDAFLASIPTASIDTPENDLSSRCKFNFSYMDFSQPAGQSFEDWLPDLLPQLCNKLLDYSRKPLTYWTNQRAGKHNILEIYNNFPKKSNFIHPKHVPHQACWARFRLKSKVRLIGFVIPSDYNKKKHHKTNFLFDSNTFYVVFLDRDHLFYK